MNQASLYQRANNVQRHDAKQILQEYENQIQWRLDGRDALIDVGSGSGNVLMDFVYPLLPPNFEQLVGTDVSAKMVSYASKNYADYKRTKFEVLDIGGDEVPNELSEQFDHVTSFYCLHWVQNQKNALHNIHKLLRPEGGDCLLVFLATVRTYDVYKSLSKESKWCSYMKDVNNFISPLHDSSDPRAEYEKLLSEAGFVDFNVEIRNEVFVYNGLKSLKDNVQAICPFLERIPEQQHEEFLDDFVDSVTALKLRIDDPETGDCKFVSPYQLVVAYARKPCGFLSNVIDNERKVKGLN